MSGKPMLVGLCGRSGSGKGYVADMFRERGIPSVDTDAVYRLMTSAADKPSECMKELVKEFGPTVMNGDNSLNRAEMRTLVFGGDREALMALNRITHKHILKKTEEEAARHYSLGRPVVLVDAPVLFESGFDRKCAKVIAVVADEETVIERIMMRDGIGREAAEARLGTQKSVDELRERADYVIENSGNDDELAAQIDSCVKDLFALADEYRTE